MTDQSAGSNDESVLLEQRPPQPVLSIRAKATVAELGETMGERFAALSRFVNANAVTLAGSPMVLYHTFEETETDLETGLPIAEAHAGEGRIQSGELPGGPAITTWHAGPDDQLGEAYARLSAWLQEHHREANGPAWEVYPWIDPTARPDPSMPPPPEPETRRIQLVQPIK